jgi:hypothetical protein
MSSSFLVEMFELLIEAFHLSKDILSISQGQRPAGTYTEDALIQGVSKIDGQTLREYSTCCKDEKNHINMGPEMLPLQVINIFY